MTCHHPRSSRWLRLEGDAVWGAPEQEGFTEPRPETCNVVLITRNCWQVKCVQCGQEWYEEPPDDAA